MFRHAIVRRPCEEMVHGITSSNLGRPDYKKALLQHDAYIDALLSCGLGVTVIDADNDYPDSTFVEDVALCTPKCCVITRPGVASRRGERDGVKEVIREWYENVEIIREPGTLEAGDIMMAGSHFYIGMSKRTNLVGANQLIKILESYDMTGVKVTMKEMLHLKTGVSYLENNNMLACWECIRNPQFEKINKIRVEKEEAFAANSVWINGNVLMPVKAPVTKLRVEKAGYQVIELDVSEFQKLDGGLSCLSLRF